MPIEENTRELDAKLMAELNRCANGASIDQLHPRIRAAMSVPVTRADIARRLDTLRLQGRVTAEQLPNSNNRLWKLATP